MPPTAQDSVVFQGNARTPGAACGSLSIADVELSFWGGINQHTGEVIDRSHPLSGQIIKDTILAIPGGRGSCSGSLVMMELMLNNVGPKALVLERPDSIITLGVLMTEEFFDKSIPIVELGSLDFQRLLTLDDHTIWVDDGRVSNSPLESQKNTTCARNDLETALDLSQWDKDALRGIHGEATRHALRLIIRMAEMMGASELIDVTQCHIDGCFFVGQGTVAFAERLRNLGGRFRVPSTINSISVDMKRWRALGVDVEFGENAERIANALVDMGALKTFTCAPYLLQDTAPRFGDRIAWGESNAVLFANSVIGARTLKIPDGLDTAIALTGRAPNAGVYRDENRLAEVIITLPLITDVDDSFWPVIGFAAGAVAKNRIPVIAGLEGLAPSLDDLKTFGAAFGTSASAPLFHIVGITPEAPTLEAVCPNKQSSRCTETPLTLDMIRSTWDHFSHGLSQRKVELISLGNPHFSVKEIGKFAQLVRNREKHKDVAVIITCGRSHWGLAEQAGYVSELERFGVQFLVDTCWCFVEEPVIPQPVKTILTNSGKYIHYGPGLTGREFCFGSLSMCAEVACTGIHSGERPLWLRNTGSGDSP
ncbi:uncharacterized protein F5Z01DRAFT_627373 [Emericellopsis atlantica]|uniref:DUF521 domain protein n=1 Tax=Emericellopsis atlantica TaxID=2614577 RepID=A0A9P7ZGU3_9HYPO|nr:uncharacterized protein F5Z01DRAFT_627373 [Emericellopsis atlantica]KAG9251557.1 hypothetical protein F5Z01DRAFT_627373 [Emericellopsis atlantica]